MRELVPMEFVLSRTRLSWREAMWGFENEYVDAVGLVDLAMSNVAGSEENSAVELELAGLLARQLARADQLAQLLADAEPAQPLKNIASKWLYVVLDRLFQSSASLEEKLGEVGSVYAEFDYPVEVASFVTWEQDLDPRPYSERSPERFEDILCSRWEAFLADGKRKYGVS